MMLLLACLVAAVLGFPIGYFLGFVHTEAEKIMDAYVRGLGPLSLYYPLEEWR